MKSKRFRGLIIITGIELFLLLMACVMNYRKGFEINLAGLAACFSALAVVGGSYMYSEMKRPSGHTQDGKPMMDMDEL